MPPPSRDGNPGNRQPALRVTARVYSKRVAVTLLTIGHSTRGIDELLALLAEHRIARLVDVRRFPASRRHPQFSREALAARLGAAGIEYVHEPDLGGRRQPDPGSPNTAWRGAAFRGRAASIGSGAFAAPWGPVLA